MPETTTPPHRELKWAHTDTRGMQRAIGESFTRAVARNWRNDQASVADLRALVVNTFLVTATLGWSPPSTSQGVMTIRPKPSSDRKDWREVQDLLMLATYALLAKDPSEKYALTADVRVQTEDGATPAAAETGAVLVPIVLGAIAIVAVVGAVAAVVSDWLDQRNQIEATKLASDTNAQKLAATLAASNQLVASHLEREAAAGQSIEWEPQELDLLAQLKSETKALAEWKAPALRPAPIAGGASEVLGGTGEAIKKVGTGASVGAGILPIALVAGAAWLLNEHERRSAAAA